MRRLIAVVVAAGIVVSNGAAVSGSLRVEPEPEQSNATYPVNKSKLPTPPEPFPILAWYGVPEQHATVERYRELADAEFTHSFNSFSNADAVAKQLDIAKMAGVKLIVGCGDLVGDKAETTVNRIKDHAGLGGYYIRDEPSAGEFEQVAAQVKRIQAADGRHPCYINLFPNYGTQGISGQLGATTYQDYVDRFVREVPVPILSFDHYPVIGGAGRASLRPEWYENLEIISAAARKAVRPFWAFALSCPNAGYPAPTTAHLRVQVYSNLAYGAQVIQYFTYWTPEPQQFNFHDAPISADGKRSVTYDLVKQMNGDLQALRGVFLGAKVLSLGHTRKTVPSGTQLYRPAAPIKELNTEGLGAVVSLSSNAGRRFLVIVNRDIHEPMPLSVGLDGSAHIHRVEKDGSLQSLTEAHFKTLVDPGDVCVLTWIDNRKD